MPIVDPKLRPVKCFDDVPLLAQCGGGRIKYVIEPYLAESSLNLLTGEPGCGKSSLVAAWAAEASKTRRVWILDKENGLMVIRERFARMRVEDNDNLKVSGCWLSTEPPDVNCDSSAAMLRKFTKESIPPPLIIVDSLIASFGGTDENDSVQMRRYLGRWRTVANFGACVTILHNSGKTGKAQKYRGSSDILASVDAAFLLTNSPPGLLKKLTLEPFKSRLGFHEKTVYNYIGGHFIMEKKPSGKTPEQTLKDLLRENPGVISERFEEIAMEAKIGRGTARSFLKSGADAGFVLCETGERNAKFYSLKVEPELSKRMSLMPQKKKAYAG